MSSRIICNRHNTTTNTTTIANKNERSSSSTTANIIKKLKFIQFVSSTLCIVFIILTTTTNQSTVTAATTNRPRWSASTKGDRARPSSRTTSSSFSYFDHAHNFSGLNSYGRLVQLHDETATESVPRSRSVP